MAFLLADMAAAVESARATYLVAARRKDAGKPYSRQASIAKLVATDAAMKVTTDAVQVLGGAGYTREFPVERYMREAKVMQIFEGTNQIQRMVIGKHLAEGVDPRPADDGAGRSTAVRRWPGAAVRAWPPSPTSSPRNRSSPHRVRAAFDAHAHKVLATLRADGSPRVSGIEMQFVAGEPWLAGMPDSVKFADLRRDPRFALHSGSAEPDAFERGRQAVRPRDRGRPTTASGARYAAAAGVPTGARWTSSCSASTSTRSCSCAERREDRAGHLLVAARAGA